MRKVTGGRKVSVQLVTEADLEQHGGKYKLQSHVATWVYYDADAPVSGDDGVILPVFPIGGSRIASGEFSVGGGASLNISISPASNPPSGHGHIAIPVYPIEGSDPLSPPGPVPSAIPDLFAWYEDDQLVFQTEGGPVAGIGDPVGYWGDLSGNGLHLTQTEAAARPTRQSTGIVFDGVNDRFVRSFPAINNPITVFAVVAYTTAGFENFQPILSVISGPPYYFFLYARYSAASPTARIYDGNEFVIGGVTNLDTDYIITGLYNGAASVVGVNGAEVTGDTGTAPAALPGYFVAGSPTGVISACRIRALLIYNAALTLAQRNIVRSYLNNNYSVY
jgi:hypothetical protein